jgi:hypothetical protein
VPPNAVFLAENVGIIKTAIEDERGANPSSPVDEKAQAPVVGRDVLM